MWTLLGTDTETKDAWACTPVRLPTTTEAWGGGDKARDEKRVGKDSCGDTQISSGILYSCDYLGFHPHTD